MLLFQSLVPINNKLGKRTRGHCVSIHHHDHHHHQQRYMNMAWHGMARGGGLHPEARASICAHSPCPVCPGLSGFASLASYSMALSLHHGPLALLPPFFVSLVFTLYLSSLRLFLSLCARPPRPMPSSQCSIRAGHQSTAVTFVGNHKLTEKRIVALLSLSFPLK